MLLPTRLALRARWCLAPLAALLLAACEPAPPLEPMRGSVETAPVVPADIDHLRTGFALRGAHAHAACESCHVRGIFQGTPRACSACHATAGMVRASAKPLDHILTQAECSQCHNERSWYGARFVHTADMGSRCFACHNGRSAMGKIAGHIPSPNTCQDCHNTRTFSLD